MWTDDGCRTDKSRKEAGNFSGSADCQWGISSALYAQSIGKLKSDAWEEITNEALKFAKLSGKQSFKVSPAVVADARACIIDSNSEDDNSDSSSFIEFDNIAQEDAYYNFPPRAVSRVLDPCIQSGTRSAPQELVSEDSISKLRPTAGLVDFSRQLPPLVSVCAENTSSFASSTLIFLFHCEWLTLSF